MRTVRGKWLSQRGDLPLVLFSLLLATPFSLYSQEADPFADVVAKETAPAKIQTENKSLAQKFFSENFGFRKEIMSEFGATTTEPHRLSSRQSVGFEVLKKFSTETKTFAAVNFQGRLVRRDGFVGSPNDMEGMNRSNLIFEYHNAYAEFYNFLDPLLSEEEQRTTIGRLNARVGRFYLPFGLNLQTDTHGTVLQLSNERNFGYERDWGIGFWGTLCEELRYDLYYLTGSGYDPHYDGQTGLGVTRISLNNQYASNLGLEAGLSLMGGERLSPEAIERSPAVMETTGGSDRVETLRVGLDARYRRPIPTGTLTWTSEVSGGKDEPAAVATQLHQLDYLHSSREWGLSSQYRWNWQDRSRDRELSPMETYGSTEASILNEATWYFSNDVSNSNLHWIKLNCEIQTARQSGDHAVIWTLQYYRYF